MSVVCFDRVRRVPLKERPIIMSGPMVRAILEGRKTQTRRIIRNQPPEDTLPYYTMVSSPRKEEGTFCWRTKPHMGCVARMRSRYGLSGDELWVRETWAKAGEVGDEIEYAADNPDPQSAKWRSPLFMPRSASRITLHVHRVRAMRLKDITEEDAIAEGAQHFPNIPTKSPYPQNAPRWSMEQPANTDQCLGTARFAFGNYWNKVNGADAWDKNPWVWALTFEVVDTNRI